MDADQEKRALAALRRADFTGHGDEGWGDSQKRSAAKAPTLRALLQERLNVRLGVDDQIQDATHFLAFVWHEPVGTNEQVTACVRFSAWGELVTSFEPVEFGVGRPLAREALIEELVVAAGFTYIPCAAVQLPYDGNAVDGLEGPAGMRSTWRTRLFEYQ